VDTDRGLLVPVIRNADKKGIMEIENEIQTLAERALSGTSLPDDLSGGTFTITNLGAFGIEAFTPIINPPEAAILGIGAILPKVIVINDQIKSQNCLMLSLSHDHRILDGAPAARFLQRLAELISRPLELFGL
jgi:pyruvate dehydrogenase E2 component (dihydrolipoamide acetyltransferase)